MKHHQCCTQKILVHRNSFHSVQCTVWEFQILIQFGSTPIIFIMLKMVKFLCIHSIMTISWTSSFDLTLFQYSLLFTKYLVNKSTKLTTTFLHFKYFLASEDKHVEYSLTDRIEWAMMVDISINYLLTGVIQVEMYPLTHQIQTCCHSTEKRMNIRTSQLKEKGVGP